MNYIIIQPEAGFTSQERAEKISEELFNISRPPHVKSESDVTKYVFGWVKHPDSDLHALHVILDYEIYVHPENNIDNLVDLFPEVPQAEKDQLRAYIENSSSDVFQFQNIIPSTAIVRDQAYMEQDGWFPVEEQVEEQE